MLEKSRISKINMLDKDGNYAIQWKKERNAKFTSSNRWKLCAEEGFGETGMNYIRTRVFEELSGVSADQDILNDSIVHGLTYEYSGLQAFKKKMGFEFIVEQKLIYGKPNSRRSSTPDALVLISDFGEKNAYEAEPAEVKCYQPEKHIKCCECENPLELKKANRQAYFQIIDQMAISEALKAYAIFFHPDMPIDAGGLHIIVFDVFEQFLITDKKGTSTPERIVKNDIKFCNDRHELALKEFERIKSKLTKRSQPLQPAS